MLSKCLFLLVQNQLHKAVKKIRFPIMMFPLSPTLPGLMNLSLKPRNFSETCHGSCKQLLELRHSSVDFKFSSPVRARGVKSRMCPPYPQRDRKRRLNGAVCRNHRIKKGGPVSVLGRAR